MLKVSFELVFGVRRHDDNDGHGQLGFLVSCGVKVVKRREIFLAVLFNENLGWRYRMSQLWYYILVFFFTDILDISMFHSSASD